MDEIYVEQIGTYPEEIIRCIKKYSYSLQKYVHQGIPRDDFSVRCALKSEYFWSCSIIQQLYKEFWNMAAKYFWVGYHVTRIQSNDEILQGGLIRLEFDSYCSRLNKILKDNGIGESEINYAIARIKKCMMGIWGNVKNGYVFSHLKVYSIRGTLTIWRKIMGVKLQNVHLRIMKGWKMFGKC